MYPEFQEVLKKNPPPPPLPPPTKGATRVTGRTSRAKDRVADMTTSHSSKGRLLIVVAAVAAGAAMAVGGRAVAQQQNFDNVQMDVVQVRPNIYMIVGAGGNTTIQFGDEGVMVVDTQFPQVSAKLLAAIKSVTDAPIRYVVSTHMHGDHIGGNEAIAKAGRTRAGGNVVGDLGAAATSRPAIIAHENVLKRLSVDRRRGSRRCRSALGRPRRSSAKKREFLFNGEAVQIIHEPEAHTDGDSLVFFRRSDVVATGDLFTTVMYPVHRRGQRRHDQRLHQGAQRDPRHHGRRAT